MEWLAQLKVMLPNVDLSIEPNMMDGLTQQIITAKAEGKVVRRQIRPKQLGQMGTAAYANMKYHQVYNGLFNSSFYEYEPKQV